MDPLFQYQALAEPLLEEATLDKWVGQEQSQLRLAPRLTGFQNAYIFYEALPVVVDFNSWLQSPGPVRRPIFTPGWFTIGRDASLDSIQCFVSYEIPVLRKTAPTGWFTSGNDGSTFSLQCYAIPEVPVRRPGMVGDIGKLPSFEIIDVSWMIDRTDVMRRMFRPQSTTVLPVVFTEETVTIDWYIQYPEAPRLKHTLRVSGVETVVPDTTVRAIDWYVENLLPIPPRLLVQHHNQLHIAVDTSFIIDWYVQHPGSWARPPLVPEMFAQNIEPIQNPVGLDMFWVEHFLPMWRIPPTGYMLTEPSTPFQPPIPHPPCPYIPGKSDDTGSFSGRNQTTDMSFKRIDDTGGFRGRADFEFETTRRRDDNDDDTRKKPGECH